MSIRMMGRYLRYTSLNGCLIMITQSPIAAECDVSLVSFVIMPARDEPKFCNIGKYTFKSTVLHVHGCFFCKDSKKEKNNFFWWSWRSCFYKPWSWMGKRNGSRSPKIYKKAPEQFKLHQSWTLHSYFEASVFYVGHAWLPCSLWKW